MTRAMLFLLLAVLRIPFDVARADEAEQLYLRSFIPFACCVTNQCCWQIDERELTPLPGDRFVVNSTGQVVPRTGWSPDGHAYRCACDYDAQASAWVRHQGAHTRCIFVPMRIGWAR